MRSLECAAAPWKCLAFYEAPSYTFTVATELNETLYAAQKKINSIIVLWIFITLLHVTCSFSWIFGIPFMLIHFDAKLLLCACYFFTVPSSVGKKRRATHTEEKFSWWKLPQTSKALFRFFFTLLFSGADAIRGRKKFQQLCCASMLKGFESRLAQGKCSLWTFSSAPEKNKYFSTIIIGIIVNNTENWRERRKQRERKSRTFSIHHREARLTRLGAPICILAHKRCV